MHAAIQTLLLWSSSYPAEHHHIRDCGGGRRHRIQQLTFWSPGLRPLKLHNRPRRLYSIRAYIRNDVTPTVLAPWDTAWYSFTNHRFTYPCGSGRCLQLNSHNQSSRSRASEICQVSATLAGDSPSIAGTTGQALCSCCNGCSGDDAASQLSTRKHRCKFQRPVRISSRRLHANAKVLQSSGL